MDTRKTKSIISIIIILTMMSGVISLPVWNESHQTLAASKKIQVKFKANGGKFAKKSKKSKKVIKRKKYGKLPKVTRTGYKFKGWYTKKKSGKKVTKKTKVKAKKKHALYARWTANKYKVTFDSRGGNTISAKTVSFGSKYGTLARPIRPGCSFLGWYTSKNIRVTANTIYNTATNTSLHAKWSVGKMGIDSAYQQTLGKTLSSINGLSKANGEITYNSKRYVTYTDSKDMEYLFENGKCISINGTGLMPNVPIDGYPLSAIEAEYGVGRLTESDNITQAIDYYEFTSNKTYIVIEFKDGLVSQNPWSSISIYKDEYIMSILNKLEDSSDNINTAGTIGIVNLDTKKMSIQEVINEYFK